MKTTICIVLGAMFAWSTLSPLRSPAQLAPERAASTQQPAFDRSTPLESRLRLPPDSLVQRYRNAPKPTPTFRDLSSEERSEVESVLGMLPAFSRRAFTGHVRSISFIDGIPANATTIKDPGSTMPVFDIVLRAGLLEETISQFLTRKERSYYRPSESNLNISVEAGSLPALLYVLLHESVHVIDISNRAGQGGPPTLFENAPPKDLTQGIWEDPTTITARYRSPLLKVNLLGAGQLEDIDSAQTKYKALSRTPFVSLYGASNWYDDAAELVSCFYLTQKLHQPYRIVLRSGTEIVYSLEPMTSALVRARFPEVMPLFDPLSTSDLRSQ